MEENEHAWKLPPPPRLVELYIGAGLLWLWALHSVVGAIQSITVQAPFSTVLIHIGRALLQGFAGYSLLELSFAGQALAFIVAAVNLLDGAGQVWQQPLTIEMAFPIAYIATGAALLVCMLLPRVRRAFRERHQAVHRHYQERARQGEEHPVIKVPGTGKRRLAWQPVEILAASTLLWGWAAYTLFQTVQSIVAAATVWVILWFIARVLLLGILGWGIWTVHPAAYGPTLLLGAYLLFFAARLPEHFPTPLEIAYLASCVVVAACLLSPRARVLFWQRGKEMYRAVRVRRSNRTGSSPSDTGESDEEHSPRHRRAGPVEPTRLRDRANWRGRPVTTSQAKRRWPGPPGSRG